MAKCRQKDSFHSDVLWNGLGLAGMIVVTFFFRVISGLLKAIWEKQSHSITSTPPPSPTNPLPQSSPHCLSARRGVSQQQLDCELEPIVLLSLQCLTHLFSWIPLSSHVTPNLMQLVFRFVGLGTQQSLPQLSNGTGM